LRKERSKRKELLSLQKHTQFINASKQVQKQERMLKKFSHVLVKSCFNRQRKKIVIVILEITMATEKLNH